MARNALSVCIPVRNEENTIKDTLNSILSQSFKGELEVLVCINGSSDNSQNIVAKLEDKQKSVKMLKSDPGKPVAWNKMFNQAKYDNLIFTDGDILVWPNALTAFVDFYKSNPNLHGAAGTCIKLLENNSFLSKVFNTPLENIPAGGFKGGLYSIKRDAFSKEMSAKGYYKMPQNIICDDTWVSLILETRENKEPIMKYWRHNKHAKAFYRAESKKDYLIMRQRHFEGRLQLIHEHPNLQFQEYFKSPGLFTKLSKAYNLWLNLDNPFDKVLAPTTYIFNKIQSHSLDKELFEKAKETYFSGKSTNLWKETSSSKKNYNFNPLLVSQF